MTLYTLSSETSNGSVCTGGCLTNWPPLVVAPGGSASGPAGATDTFSTITRADDGSTEVAYNGRPLYYFAHDAATGQTNGEGIKAFGGVWLVAALSGAPSSVQLGSGTSATLGTFLTGAGGMTLYTLSSDPNNGTVCTGGCLTFWPPLLIAPGGSTTVPASATGTFGSFVRADGTVEVTQDSRPLYYFAHDTAPGQTNGEGIKAFGGVWHVAAAVRAAAAGAGPATASGAVSGRPATPGATPASEKPASPPPTASVTTRPTAAPTPRPTATHRPATPPPATPPPATGGQAVRISDFAFAPPTITVSVGTRVTWTNRQPAIQHTVTADDGSFGSDPLSTGSSFTHVFAKARTYSYHCSIHPDMTGTVVITG